MLEHNQQNDPYWAELYKVSTQLDFVKSGIYERIAEYAAEMDKRGNYFKRFNDDIFVYFRQHYQSKRALKCKLNAREVIQSLIDEAFVDSPEQEAYVAIGGSTVNGCGGSDSDLDLCIVAKNPAKIDEIFDQEREFHVEILRKAYATFYEYQQKFDYLRFVDTARVPIIVCRLGHPYDDGTLIEINCNNIAGIYNSHLLHYYAKVDGRFPMMALVLKTWGAMEQVIDPRHGRVNSYTMLCMIIHFLQCATYPPILPNLVQLCSDFFGGTTPIPELVFFQDLPIELPKIQQNEKTVGELIIAFWQYFHDFKYARDAVSLRDAKIFPRYQLREEYRMQKWLFYLEEVYDYLTIPKNLKEPSVLEEIVLKYENAVNQHLVLRQIPNFRAICPEAVKKLATDEYENQHHINF